MRLIEVGEKIEVSGGGSQFVLPTFREEVEFAINSEKRKILNYFFTNVDGDVRAIRGTLPGVLAAAIITRLSRSEEPDATEVFWNEFFLKPELGMQGLTGQMVEGGLEEHLAEEKASRMIRRIIDSFGDDSVREQASAHLIVQNVSVLHSMEAFLHPLVTGIEVSTRYNRWGKDENGEYAYVRPRIIMESTHAEQYQKVMDFLFETYNELWDPLWDHIVDANPKSDEISQRAYDNMVKGRVCDNLRKLLPLGIKTNFGLHADFRSLSELAMNLQASGLQESREKGKQIAEQLKIINPEFISVVESDHGKQWIDHKVNARGIMQDFAERSTGKDHERESIPGVRVEVLNKDYLFDLVRTALSVESPSASKKFLDQEARELIRKGKHVGFLNSLGNARTNRRHKFPEILENIVVRVNFDGLSYGSAKDFNRHRKNLSKQGPDWSGEIGVFVPEDIKAMGGEYLDKYKFAQETALEAFQDLRIGFPSEARLLLTHGIKTSMEITMGLSQAYWIAELRSIASGDPEYRWYAQQLFLALLEKIPEIRYLGSFVDMEDYGLGRIGEAVKADLRGVK